MGGRNGSGWSDRLLNTAIGLVVAFALIIAIKGGVQVVYNALGEQEPKWLSAFDAEPVAKTFNLLVTTTVIVAGAYVGYRKFFLFRENKAQLTVTLTISSRQASDQFLHIGAIAKAENTGKVNVDIGRIYWQVAALSPYDDEVVEEMRAAFSDPNESTPSGDNNVIGTIEPNLDEFPWRLLGKFQTKREGMTIEPNETDELTFDIVAPVGVEAVAVSLFVENQETESDETPVGWYRRKYHDIVVTQKD